MSKLELFSADRTIGVFRGFLEGGLEFHADLVFPYRNEFQSIPMHGSFVLVQLETPDEAVLGRIASFTSSGRLSSGSGEEFNIRAVKEQRPIPEDIREQYLKYKVNIRVLGVLRASSDGELSFVPSHRRLPHVGSPVAFPSSDVLRQIAGHNNTGAELGHFALGEYVYGGREAQNSLPQGFQALEPDILTRFPVESLVSRRTLIFARAGFGKSNLNKLLFSKLYENTPKVTKRGGKQVPVGTLVFDPDGEYFWPDDKDRPGLCDVPWLQSQLVVFTSRTNPSPYYQSFVAGGVKLDIRRLRPADVIAIALDPERQEQQNVRKLKGMSQDRWAKLVDLIDQAGNATPIQEVSELLHLDGSSQEVEAVAARSNMTVIVRTIHDKSSQLMDMLMRALSDGKLCIVDVSQMRGSQALVLSGLILRRIFDRNQQEFTKAEPRTIPTIAVVEEAQAVLSHNTTTTEPFISWVKEGRKYDLGAVLVTQQPGSIPTDILSQGDNWFVFHLLSASDLGTLRKANAHFSEDLLGVLLNEPIPGQGVFWSSVGKQAYPLSLRVLSFEEAFPAVDLEYRRPAEATYAAELVREFEHALAGVQTQPVADKTVLSFVVDGHSSVAPSEVESTPDDSEQPNGRADVLAQYERGAIDALRADELMDRIRDQGAPWGGVKAFMLDHLPSVLDDRETIAYHLVAKALNEILGPQDEAWHSYKNLSSGHTWVRAGAKPT